MNNQIDDITENDFTSLYIASDVASKIAQASYVKIMAIDLIVMIIASGIALFNYQSENSKHFLYPTSGILLLISLMLTIILLTKKFEDVWYQSRALAESCKTLSWRFMTCSELFEINVSSKEVKERFINRIKELKGEFKELDKVLNTEILNRAIITPVMLAFRDLPLDKRKEYYIQYRIEDQKNWYSKKAKLNKEKYNLWFSIIIISQALSLVSIVYLISNPKSNWNFVSLFTTIAAAALSWLQLKRHQELKQSYTTASQELNIINALSNEITNENEFSKFVLDSENAVSREHTLWLAQRRK